MQEVSQSSRWTYLGHLFVPVQANEAELYQLQQLDSTNPFSCKASLMKEKSQQLQSEFQCYFGINCASKKIKLKLLVEQQLNRQIMYQRMTETEQREQFNIKIISMALKQNMVGEGFKQIFILDGPNLIRFDKIPTVKSPENNPIIQPIPDSKPGYLGQVLQPSGILPAISMPAIQSLKFQTQIKKQSNPQQANTHLMANYSLQNLHQKSVSQQKLKYQCLLSVNIYILSQCIKQWDETFDMDPQYSTKSKFTKRIDLLMDNLKSNESNWNKRYMDEQIKKKNFPIVNMENKQDDLQEEENEKKNYLQNDLDEGQKGKKKFKIFDLATYNINQTQQPDGFEGELIPYQKQALTWMMFREDALKNINIDMTHSINWQNLKQILSIDQDLYFNHQYSVILTKRPLKQCKGGIIADQMGLGKTIMMISLILAHRPTADSRDKATLVISPLSVLSEWENHFKKFAPSLRIFQYYESGRKLQKLQRIDVVLISEGVLRSQYAKSKDLNKKELTIFDIQWFRVIIDEAHNFKNFQSQGSNAVWELFTQYRWCLTGTPAQNSYGDLYSLMKFLHYKPWDNLQKWNSLLPKNKDKKKEKDPFLTKKIQEILKGIMIRRTKSTKNSQGEKLLQLPSLLNLQLEVQLEENIKKDYQFLVQITLKKLKQLQKAEKQYQSQTTVDKIKRFKQRKQIQKMVNFIMAKIMILRQLCCHSFLFNYSKELVRYDQFIEKYDKFLAKKNIRSFKRNYQSFQKIREIANKSKIKCQICKQIPIFGVISPCLHVYCKQCATAYAKQQLLRGQQNNKSGPITYSFQESIMKTAKKKLKKRLSQIEVQCFACKAKIKYENFFPMPRLNQFDRQIQQFEYNQKFSMLVHGLRQLKQGEKAIIYTNFLGVVMLLEQTMRRQRIVHQVIKGDDKQKSRVAKLRDFQAFPQVRVLIITLKSGCVGLNLQIANKIFIMDPWWNPFIEDQAIARSHRIGQLKDVQVVTFVTKNTIEERVKQLKSVKREIIADLMMDQLEQEDSGDEDFEEEKPKRKKVTKLKKTEQFKILLQENQKYHKMIQQMQQQEYEQINNLNGNQQDQSKKKE